MKTIKACSIAVFWIGAIVFVCTFSCNTATRLAAAAVGACQ